MIEDFYYTVDDGTLFLSSDPDGKFAASTRTDYDDILHWPWTDNPDITKVVIEDRIAPSTCRRTFAELDHLNEIEGLSNLDASHVTDMADMFLDCVSLKSLDLSDWDTSHVTDMSHMFDNCPSLTSIEGHENLDTSNVTDMSCMFYLCRSLASLDVSSFDTSNVADMTGMFLGCDSLTSIEGLENLDTSNVTSMCLMFEGCACLTSLDLSGWDTGGVTRMEGMFHRCRSITSLDLSSFDTSKVRDMILMFDHCPSLTSLDLSGWDTGRVEDMTDMFHDCPSLETVTTNDQRIISEVPDVTKVVEPPARADRDATPSLEATISQFSATADALQAAVTALQGNIADMRETFGSDPR